jgi:hypothetical protein
MSDKPSRWFQIHLSTAIVMMLAAGVLLYFNLRLHRDSFADIEADVNVPVTEDGPIAIPAKRVTHVLRTIRGIPAKPMTSSGDCVAILDGSPSWPASKITEYRWAQTSGYDLKLSASDLNKKRLGLRIFEEGEYCFTLTVSTPEQTSKPTSVLVKVVDELPRQTLGEIILAAVISLIVLIVTVAVCESVIHRREARKP